MPLRDATFLQMTRLLQVTSTSANTPQPRTFTRLESSCTSFSRGNTRGLGASSILRLARIGREVPPWSASRSASWLQYRMEKQIYLTKILSKKFLPKKIPEKSLKIPQKKPPELYQQPSKSPPKFVQKSPQKSSKNPPESYLKKSRIPKIWTKIRYLFPYSTVSC